MADAADSKSVDSGREGSTPSPATNPAVQSEAIAERVESTNVGEWVECGFVKMIASLDALIGALEKDPVCPKRKGGAYHADPDNSGQCIYCGRVLDGTDDVEYTMLDHLRLIVLVAKTLLKEDGAPGTRAFAMQYFARLTESTSRLMSLIEKVEAAAVGVASTPAWQENVVDSVVGEVDHDIATVAMMVFGADVLDNRLIADHVERMAEWHRRFCSWCRKNNPTNLPMEGHGL